MGNAFEYISWVLAIVIPFIPFDESNPEAYQIPTVVLTVCCLLNWGRRRWQLVPLYGSVIFTLSVGFLNWSGSVTIGVILLILNIVTVIADYFLPVMPVLPHSGPHSVGELTIHLNKDSSPSIRAALAKSKFDADYDFTKPPVATEVTYKIWYPAETPSFFTRIFGRRGWLFPKGGLAIDALLKHGINSESKILKTLLSHQSRARSYAHVGAPVKKGTQWPLLMFSHGLTGIPENYTSVCAPVASHGFIVVAPTHTDGTAPQCFSPDGFEIPFNSWTEDTLPGKPEIWLLRNWGQTQRVADLKFIMETMDALNKDVDPGYQISIVDENTWPRATTKRSSKPYFGQLFKNTIDMSRVGVYGHSFGGCTVYETLAQLPQVRGGVAYDPYLLLMSEHQKDLAKYNKFRGMPADTPPPPVMVVPSELWQWGETLDYIARAHDGVYSKNPESIYVTLLQSRHHNFSDICNLAERITNRQDVSGPIPAHVGLQTLVESTVAFFNHVMPPNGKGSNAKSGADKDDAKKPLLSGPETISASPHMRVENMEYIRKQFSDEQGWGDLGYAKFPNATFKL